MWMTDFGLSEFLFVAKKMAKASKLQKDGKEEKLL